MSIDNSFFEQSTVICKNINRLVVPTRLFIFAYNCLLLKELIIYFYNEKTEIRRNAISDIFLIVIAKD